MNDERHVLIVEDDEVSSARLAGYIEAAGYRVTEVSDGKKMADTLENDPADLILLDRDIFKSTPQEISGTQVDLTMLGGEAVYRSDQFNG